MEETDIEKITNRLSFILLLISIIHLDTQFKLNMELECKWLVTLGSHNRCYSKMIGYNETRQVSYLTIGLFSIVAFINKLIEPSKLGLSSHSKILPQQFAIAVANCFAVVHFCCLTNLNKYVLRSKCVDIVNSFCCLHNISRWIVLVIHLLTIWHKPV